MSFNRLSFTKNWTNPTDFPTVESDEAQVRADMQILHDESKNGLNRLMDQLEAASAAADLGAQAVDGSGASTLQRELNAIHGRMEKKLGSVTGVVTTLGADHTTIPTSKAVSDAIGQSGNLPAGGGTGQVLVKGSDANYDLAWASITPKSLGALRVASGRYTGTGTVGSGSKNTLTFDFEPYLLVVRSNGAGAPVVFVKGANAKFPNPKVHELGECLLRVSWGSDRVSWYADTYTGYASYGDSEVTQGSVTDVMQLNSGYLTYNWVAIGL